MSYATTTIDSFRVVEDESAGALAPTRPRRGASSRREVSSDESRVTALCVPVPLQLLLAHIVGTAGERIQA
jgi:hypothetical protein